MKREWLAIENGICEKNGKEWMYAIHIRAFEKEIMGVISDNNFELNYLLQIMCGQMNFSSGRIYYDGVMLNREGDTGRLMEVTSVINEKSKLIPNLTISQNIFAVRKKTQFFYHKKEMEHTLRKTMDLLGLDFSIEMPVKSLNIVQRIQLELLKAFLMEKNIVYLDLRSIYLSRQEQQQLYNFLSRYKMFGAALLIFDSNVRRAFELSEQIVVMSGGKTAGIISATPENCQKTMNQKNVNIQFSYKEEREEVLRFQGVSTRYLKNLNFSLKRGEIKTVIVSDWGMEAELIRLLKGKQTPMQGEILIEERRYRPQRRRNPWGQSVVIIEPPFTDLLFHNLNVYDNLCLPRGMIRRGLWSRKEYRRSIRQYIIDVFGRDICECGLTELSLSELHKLVYQRWIMFSPKVVVCVNPIVSVDIHLGAEAVGLIQELAKKGAAVLVLTESVQMLETLAHDQIFIEGGHMVGK